MVTTCAICTVSCHDALQSRDTVFHYFRVDRHIVFAPHSITAYFKSFLLIFGSLSFAIYY